MSISDVTHNDRDRDQLLSWEVKERGRRRRRVGCTVFYASLEVLGKKVVVVGEDLQDFEIVIIPGHQ